MKRVLLLTLVGSFILSLLLPGFVGADKVYHSERLDFWLTEAGDLAGHPELRSGHVVNIHPNGPVNGALERYMINGAKPDTSYQVVILVSEIGCVGEPTRFSTALLETNRKGNAQGKAGFSPADLAGFSGQTFGVRWILEAGNVAAYETDCTIVSVD
ncbi:MAG: hypothetical protein AB7G75_31310 [Candidatus Binatia bacterium]